MATPLDWYCWVIKLERMFQMGKVPGLTSLRFQATVKVLPLLAMTGLKSPVRGSVLVVIRLNSLPFPSASPLAEGAMVAPLMTLRWRPMSV